MDAHSIQCIHVLIKYHLVISPLFSSPPQVNLVLDDGRSLGLMIRGGAEYSLGIYITGVDRGSAAECGGLKVQFSFFFNSLFALNYILKQQHCCIHVELHLMLQRFCLFSV